MEAKTYVKDYGVVLIDQEGTPDRYKVTKGAHFTTVTITWKHKPQVAEHSRPRCCE